MTTWENTDSINESENLTVTSDAAFERVTNDFKIEEENDWWFLKQNTAWLVQEVPNISFLDIADTMLESKKTFHKRENRVLRIGNAGKSVEAQPQDTVTLKLTDNYVVSLSWAVVFDDWVSSLNFTVCRIDEDNPYKIKILQTWYYRISYWWTIDPWNSTMFEIWVYWQNGTITADSFDWWSYWDKMSWWRTIWNVYLEEWDYIFMDVLANDTLTFFKNYTYLDIQFQQYTL